MVITYKLATSRAPTIEVIWRERVFVIRFVVACLHEDLLDGLILSKQVLTSELRSPFGPSGRLASRRPSARLEPSLKGLAGWVSWHQGA
jgi:hypothetical protein